MLPHAAAAVALFPRGGSYRLRDADSSANIKKKKLSKTKTQTDQSIWNAIGTAWYKIPHAMRYFVSGNIGNLCLYFLERAVRTTLQTTLENPPKHLDSISYFAAYLLHIVLQHASHALLVYGLSSVNTREKYRSTLVGTYQAYIFSAFGSTFVNSYLMQTMGVNRDIAFVTTLWIFACMNYFYIGYVVNKANQQDADAQTKKSKFVSRRQQAKMAVMRGGHDAFHEVVQDWLLGSTVATIPHEVSP